MRICSQLSVALFIPALEAKLENMIRDTLWIKLMEINTNGFQMN
jgi:hypothetical protein